MQVKRLLQIVVIATTANMFILGQSSAVETVVVTGKKCDYGSCGSGPFYDQPRDYDPFAVPGGGGGTSSESTKVKSVMDTVDISCRPAGKSASTHTADNYGGCMVQASDKYAAAYGEVAAGFAFSALSTACTERLNSAPAC